MQHSLYEFYSDHFLNIYEVREHFLEHFYYQDHSKNKARKVLRSIVDSTRVHKLLDTSIKNGVVPSCVDFLSAIHGMLIFMLASNETQILATMDAVIRWDVEVNAKLHLIIPQDLKQEAIKVFNKYQINKTIIDDELSAIEYSRRINKESMKEIHEGESSSLSEERCDVKSWSLVAFSKMFDNMQVGEFVNKETGDIFHSCIFSKKNDKTFVAFSSKLGELTAEEIEDMKSDLVVVRSDKGRYSLHKAKGNKWKKVNI